MTSYLKASFSYFAIAQKITDWLTIANGFDSGTDFRTIRYFMGQLAIMIQGFFQSFTIEIEAGFVIPATFAGTSKAVQIVKLRNPLPVADYYGPIIVI